MDLALLGALASIVIIDLVLSGDNAVVIGMAASRLPAEQRRKAIIWGGAGAVGLRIFFTILAALLLTVPLLQATGSFLLLYIAWKLLKPVHAADHEIAAAGSLREALQTIIMADVIMSLDNILAVGGAARGHLGLLVFGLALSIPILLFGSSLIARAIDRYPILNYIGSGILIVTATRMFFHDAVVHDYIALGLPGEVLVIFLVTALVLGLGYLMNRRAQTAALATARARVAEGKSPREAAREEEPAPGGTD